ncbi:MAG: TlpA family protein disulfide reductase [Candidatus Pacebacteria bacterium]|nr:TlpA family protein disulfide reductase [Candidatus Paceibacterota bacterium]
MDALSHRVRTWIRHAPRGYVVGTAVIVVALGILITSLPSASTAPAYEPDLGGVLLMTRAGEKVTLESVTQGRPAIINAWASWCPFCTTELPDLISVQEEFGDAVVVVAVNRHEDQEQAEKYLASLGASEGLVYLYDPIDSLYQTIGGYVMPETVFLYADGRMAKHQRGPLSLDVLRHHTRLLIAGEPVAPLGAEPVPGDHVVGCRDGEQCVF